MIVIRGLLPHGGNDKKYNSNRTEGEPNNMNMQYEIAKMVTKNKISDEEIDKELVSLTKEEWDEQCAILDKMIKEHIKENLVNHKAKPEEEIILQDLINIGTANNVSETTVWVAYLKWMNVGYIASNEK